jgi:hypothetical protein
MVGRPAWSLARHKGGAQHHRVAERSKRGWPSRWPGTGAEYARPRRCEGLDDLLLGGVLRGDASNWSGVTVDLGSCKLAYRPQAVEPEASGAEDRSRSHGLPPQPDDYPCFTSHAPQRETAILTTIVGTRR